MTLKNQNKSFFKYSENIIMEKPTIEIEYCTKCKWLNRASWVSQELLSTFNEDILFI